MGRFFLNSKLIRRTSEIRLWDSWGGEREGGPPKIIDFHRTLTALEARFWNLGSIATVSFCLGVLCSVHRLLSGWNYEKRIPVEASARF